jgi:hypothetical protein
METATSAGAATTAGDVDRIRGLTIAIAVPQHEQSIAGRLLARWRGGVWIDLIPELENTENASSQMQCLTSSPTDRRGTPRQERRLQIACGHNFRTNRRSRKGARRNRCRSVEQRSRLLKGCRSLREAAGAEAAERVDGFGDWQHPGPGMTHHLTRRMKKMPGDGGKFLTRPVVTNAASAPHETRRQHTSM